MWFDATKTKGVPNTCRHTIDLSLCLMQKVRKKLAGLENRAYLCSEKKQKY